MLRFLALALSLAIASSHAAESTSPDQAQMRKAVTQGLAYLDKQANQWMDDRNCNGCHHMPGFLWSHREARQRGFTIDESLFNEAVDWSYTRTKDMSPGLEMAAFLKLAMPEKPAPQLTDLITKAQRPDGSWKPAGQFASMQRREATEAAGNSARLFLLALGTQPADQAIAADARSKAADFLSKSDPPKSLETLVFRALYHQRFGPPDQLTKDRAQILKLQHPDGGWSWMIAQEKSDALATGEALYLLQQSPDPASAGAITRAQAWLIAQQGDDGGWHTDVTRISRLDRSAEAKAKSLKDATELYAFWGSAWALIGLEQAFPVVDSPRGGAQP